VSGKTRVVFNANGGVVLYRNGKIVYTDGNNVETEPVADNFPDLHINNRLDANRTTATEPEIGDRMADGTIYAGTSPDTNKPMYVTPEDVPLTMEWKQAMEHPCGVSGAESFSHLANEMGVAVLCTKFFTVVLGSVVSFVFPICCC